MATAVENCPSKDQRQPLPSEHNARVLVAPYIDGELISIPDPPDFVICQDGEATGWVEVTTALDADRAAFADRLKKDGDTFDGEGLRYDWLVMLRTSTRLKDLDREALTEAFSAYESKVGKDLGLMPSFDVTYDRDIGPGLVEAGVISAHPAEPEHDGVPMVTLFQKVPGSSSNANGITELAVAKAEWKAKSLSGRNGERHLVVLVNFDEVTGAGFALSNTDIPDDIPSLPTEITDVWLSSVRTLIWHFQRGTDRWRLIEVDA